MTTSQLPRVLELDGDDAVVPRNAFYLSLQDNQVRLELEETEDGKTTRKPRFSMQVNSGIPMAHWWWGTLAVNLSGVTWQGSSIAALLDHDTSKRVGFTTKLYVDDDKGLMAEGVMLSNETAQEVRQDSADGFPFQASCYLVASKMLQLEEGAEHEVNGHTIVGPALVFEASELREVTMCALGQDPNTSSDASLADSEERIRVPVTVKASAMTTTTPEPTPAPTPAEPVVNADAVRLEAQATEQTRVTDILELANDCQMTLARELIADVNCTALAAAKRLSADLRARDAAAAPATLPTANTAAMSAPAAPTQPASDPETAALDALPDGEDKWRAQWAADPKLRGEFTDENTWLSFNRNHAKCSNFAGSREAFDGNKGNN